MRCKQAIFDRLTANFSCSVGKTESQRERNDKQLKAQSLTYGEFDFETIFKVFKWVQKNFKDKDET